MSSQTPFELCDSMHGGRLKRAFAQEHAALRKELKCNNKSEMELARLEVETATYIFRLCMMVHGDSEK